MKITYMFGLMLAASVVLTGCGDDDDSGATPGTNQTKTQLITAKNYKWTGFTLQGQDMFNNPFFGPDACMKDDLVKFNANGTFTTTDAGVACNPTSADSGTWTFLANETKLQQIVDGDTTVADIAQLDATTLKLSTTDPVFGTAVITLTAQ